MVHRQLLADPPVRMIVVPAHRSIATCRLRGERCPKIVKDRQQAAVVTDLEIPWTILDFEDVVMQRRGRRVFDELESCRLRHPAGIYGEPDDEWHFRTEIGAAAGAELIKA